MLTKTQKFGAMAALISTIFISTYSTFSKVLLEHFSTYSLAAMAQMFSVVTLLIFFGAFSEFKNLQKLSYKQVWALIMVGLFSAVIQPLFLFQGLLKTNAINGVLISRTQMVIVGIISALWLRERVTGQQIVGTIVMLSGAYFIATKGLTVPMQLGNGDTLLLVAAFFGALSTNVFKMYLSDVSPHLVVLMRNVFGVVLNLTIVPVIFGFQHSFAELAHKEVFFTALAFTLIAIVGAQYLWYKSVEMIPANAASTIGMTSPFFGVLVAVTVLGESLAYFHMIGGLLIIIGLIYSTLHRHTHEHHKRHLTVKNWMH